MRFQDGSDPGFKLDPLPLQLRNIFVQLCEPGVGSVEGLFRFHLCMGNNQLSGFAGIFLHLFYDFLGTDQSAFEGFFPFTILFVFFFKTLDIF